MHVQIIAALVWLVLAAAQRHKGASQWMVAATPPGEAPASSATGLHPASIDTMGTEQNIMLCYEMLVLMLCYYVIFSLLRNRPPSRIDGSSQEIYNQNLDNLFPHYSNLLRWEQNRILCYVMKCWISYYEMSIVIWKAPVKSQEAWN